MAVVKEIGIATKDWVMKEIRCLYEEIMKGDFQDIKAKVSEEDGLSNFLENKLIASTGISISKVDTGIEEQLVFTVLSGALGFTKREIGNGVTVIGSDGITSSLASGVLTITLDEQAILVWAMVEVDPTDATYAAGNVSGGFKVRIDHSSKGVTLLRNPRVFIKTDPNSGVSSQNPLQHSMVLSADQRVDEFSNGIVGHVFQQVNTRASGGCFIVL